MEQKEKVVIVGGVHDPRKTIGLFLGIIFGSAWALLIAARLCNVHYGGEDGVFNVLFNVMLLLPALAVLITRKICGEKINVDALWIPPHFRGNIQRYLFAYFFPTMLTVLAAFAFFSFSPGSFDPTGSTFIKVLTDSGIEQKTASDFVYSQIGMAVFLGPMVNVVIAFTEMLGFQGYLVPRMVQFFGKHAQLKAALAGSAVWSLWYLPLYLDGYLYGSGYDGFPVVGMLLGTLFYFLLGIVMSYLTLRTGSMIPAMLIRGGVMATAVIAAMYFTKVQTSLLIGPSVYGICGSAALALFALLYVFRILRTEREKKFYNEQAAAEKRETSSERPKALPGKR